MYSVHTSLTSLSSPRHYANVHESCCLYIWLDGSLEKIVEQKENNLLHSQFIETSAGVRIYYIHPFIHSSIRPSFHPFRPSSHICKLARVFCKIRFSWPLLKVLGFLKSFKIFGGLNHSIISCAYWSQLIFKISCFKLKI